MKKILISTAQFISVLLIFILLFISPSVLIPVSTSLLEKMNPDEMKLFFPLLLLFALYMTSSFWLLIRNSSHKKSTVFMYLTLANFILFPLMGLFESVFWLDSLGVLDYNEIMKIFFRFLITFTLFSGYLTILYKRNSEATNEGVRWMNFKLLAQKLLLIGVIYMFIYNLFGYFVAWQFEATRVYYTGSSELKGFFTMLYLNLSDPKFVIVHFCRGLFFGLSGYLFYSLLNCSKPKKAFILALIFGGFGFQIILPNPIFPELVRISHFIETTSSMIIFGLIVGYVFSYRKNKISIDLKTSLANHIGFKA